MRLRFIALFALIPALCRAEDAPSAEGGAPAALSLRSAIEIAVENNYEIRRQRLALQSARAQYRQAVGALDVEAGAEASLQFAQNPVDTDDPTSEKYTGIFLENTPSQTAGGRIFVRKLFDFGLDSKLSYTIQRSKSWPDYKSDIPGLSSPRYDATSGGKVSLELSLPLFKSFRNSLVAMQIDTARDYIEQMEGGLGDEISKAVVNVVKCYWNYYLAQRRLELLRGLGEKLSARVEGIGALIRAGVRTRNDLLALRVNENENRRQVQDATVQVNAARTALLSAMGISDGGAVVGIEDPFASVDLNSIVPPDPASLGDDFVARVEESRADLRSLRKRAEIAGRRVRMARADTLPDASLNFNIGTTGTAYSDGAGQFLSSGFRNVRGVNVGGSLSVSARLGNNSKEGAVEQAEAEYASILASYAEARNALALNVRDAAEKVAVYRDGLSDGEDVISLHRELYENEQRRFGAGLITVHDLQDQDQRYVQAELSYCQNRINFMSAILDFKFHAAQLVGVDLGDLGAGGRGANPVGPAEFAGSAKAAE